MEYVTVNFRRDEFGISEVLKALGFAVGSTQPTRTKVLGVVQRGGAVAARVVTNLGSSVINEVH